MSTLQVNDIVNSDGSVVGFPGRAVTVQHYVTTKFQGFTGASSASMYNSHVLDSFVFYKKYGVQESVVLGIWGINNLMEGSQAQWYSCKRDGFDIGEYRLRHGNTGWSMSYDTFTWLDVYAPRGSLTYKLTVKEYVSNLYYNYPTNLSGSPDGSSTFLMMEITI